MACFSIQQAEPFRGLRLLLVEDDFLIAQAIKRMLVRFGCDVVGPIGDLKNAKTLVERERLDGGLLDINIRGGTSSEVARMFAERGTPFLFITGYTSPPLDEDDLIEHRRLLKPISESVLRAAMFDEFVRDA
jgi:two-component SAPR family response regulator